MVQKRIEGLVRTPKVYENEGAGTNNKPTKRLTDDDPVTSIQIRRSVRDRLRRYSLGVGNSYSLAITRILDILEEELGPERLTTRLFNFNRQEDENRGKIQ